MECGSTGRAAWPRASKAGGARHSVDVPNSQGARSTELRTHLCRPSCVLTPSLSSSQRPPRTAAINPCSQCQHLEGNRAAFPPSLPHIRCPLTPRPSHGPTHAGRPGRCSLPFTGGPCQPCKVMAPQGTAQNRGSVSIFPRWGGLVFML